MRLLITSDTHGYNDGVIDYLWENKVDLLVHAGDYTSDAKEISEVCGLDYVTVKGNNDYFDHINPYERVLKVGKHKIFLLHGHLERVYMGESIAIQKAKERGCDILIFGHTHVYQNYLEKDIIVLNPGSPSLARDGNPGFLIADIDDKIEIKRITL